MLTGEGAFDFSSGSGKVPYGVAAVAAEALQPCIALAGRVLVGARETRALGMESAYAVVDLVGEDGQPRRPGGQPGRPRGAGRPDLVPLSGCERPGPLWEYRESVSPLVKTAEPQSTTGEHVS